MYDKTIVTLLKKIQSIPFNVNTGKVNNSPNFNTSPGQKLKKRVNSKKIRTPENSNRVIGTKCSCIGSVDCT